MAAIETPSEVPTDIAKILVSADEVDAGITRTADFLLDTYGTQPGDLPLFVALLSGAMPFASRLMFRLAELSPVSHPQLEFMTISRYGLDRKPIETPRVVMGLPPDAEAKGRRIIVLDDLIEEGKTIEFATSLLLDLGAVSVENVPMVTKNIAAERSCAEPLFCPFPNLPDEWLTGMGMDNAASFTAANRWLPYIAIASAE